MPSPQRFAAAPLRSVLWAALLALWLALWLVGSAPALAQSTAANRANSSNSNDNNAALTADTPTTADIPQVDTLRKQLDALATAPDDDDASRKILAQVNAIGAAAEQVIKQRTTELSDLDSRLAGLGPAPEKGSPADAPDVAEQRSALSRQRASVDAEVKLARLISVDAEQRGTELIRQRRALFQAVLTARVQSPFSVGLWRNWVNALPSDGARLGWLGQDLHAAYIAASEAPRGPGRLAAHWLGALALLFLAPWLAHKLIIRTMPHRLPEGRLRRSLLAALVIVVNVVIVWLAVRWAWNGLRIGGALADDVRTLQNSTLRLAAYGTFVIALGQTLLSRKRASWRLLPISDALAQRLSPYPWLLALTSALGGLAIDLCNLAALSLSAEVVVSIVFSLAMAAIALSVLRHLHSAETDGAEKSLDGAAQQSLWVGIIAALGGLAAIAILLSAALGFVAFAATLARQMVWTGVVLATFYLLITLADDLCEALLSSKGGVGTRLHNTLGLDAQLLDQTAAITSGLLRIALFFYAVIALLAPFGTGPDEVFRRGSAVDRTLKVGEFTLAPQALFTAALVVCGGFLALRLLKRWLTDRYFPNTSLEPGMRSSITTLLGYAGGVVVIAAALAGLGISVERIAWVASALSVGIGFGLQAIVQNFISGLILLAERPVKVGDWVILGTTEGDVRRVNVRATEIQLSDRSTVIVPNSEFITKTVRNMTLAGAPGRVLLRLPAPLDTDAHRMREIILQAYAEHEGILGSPAPVVQLDGIENGTLTFLCIGYVNNPRNASGVRSDLLFTILERLRQAGLHLSPPATTTVTAPLPSDGVAGDAPTPPFA